MLTVGESSMVCSEASVSSPMASPTRYSRSRSNEAARAMATGYEVEYPLPTFSASRQTPRGPSRNLRPLIWRALLSGWLKMVAPGCEPRIWSAFSFSCIDDSAVMAAVTAASGIL